MLFDIIYQKLKFRSLSCVLLTVIFYVPLSLNFVGLGTFELWMFTRFLYTNMCAPLNSRWKLSTLIPLKIASACVHV